MRIMIAGGSGLIGRELTTDLVNAGDEVIILSRNPSKVSGLPAEVRILQWDSKTIGGWSQEIEKSDAVVNLTGENLSGEGFFPSWWTSERKNLLLQSRVDSGKVLSQAIQVANHKPSTFVQASGIGFYGTRQTKPLSEGDSAGDDFLAKLSLDWEASSQAVEQLGVRRVVVRNGVVLSTQGGALPRLLLPYRLYAGGRFGSGMQVYSWIHIADEAGAIQWLIHNPQARGVYNLTAPNPVTNDEFGRTIARVMQRPHYLPVPAFAMRTVLGEVSSVVLEGQRVLPTRLLEQGYQFRFPILEDALQDLLKK